MEGFKEEWLKDPVQRKNMGKLLSDLLAMLLFGALFKYFERILSNLCPSSLVVMFNSLILYPYLSMIFAIHLPGKSLQTTLVTFIIIP